VPAREQKFALDLKQVRFDRACASEAPQQACQSMNEHKLQHGSRINTGDKGALERSVGLGIVEIPNHGLISEPVTPSAAV
jgi:hypothetical protein